MAAEYHIWGKERLLSPGDGAFVRSGLLLLPRIADQGSIFFAGFWICRLFPTYIGRFCMLAAPVHDVLVEWTVITLWFRIFVQPCKGAGKARRVGRDFPTIIPPARPMPLPFIRILAQPLPQRDVGRFQSDITHHPSCLPRIVIQSLRLQKPIILLNIICNALDCVVCLDIEATKQILREMSIAGHALQI